MEFFNGLLAPVLYNNQGIKFNRFFLIYKVFGPCSKCPGCRAFWILLITFEVFRVSICEHFLPLSDNCLKQ